MTSSLRRSMRKVGRSHPHSDRVLWAAGLTLFGMIGVVPLLMIALAAAGTVVGDERMLRWVDGGLEGVPQEHGAHAAVRAVARTSAALGWPELAVLVLPASMEGEGLRRAFLQVSPERPSSFTGWRGRLAMLPVLCVAPLGAVALLACAPALGRWYAHGGAHLVLGIVTAFHLVFAVGWAIFAVLFRSVGTDPLDWRALALGSAATAAVVSGLLQGFLLFVALPVDWSAPFGGLPALGTTVALALWLHVLHLVVLLGYRLSIVASEQWEDSARHSRPASGAAVRTGR